MTRVRRVIVAAIKTLTAALWQTNVRQQQQQTGNNEGETNAFGEV